MKHVVVLSNQYYPTMTAPSAVFDKYLKELKSDYKFHILTKTYDSNFEPLNDLDITYITCFTHKILQKCSYNQKKKRHLYISSVLIYLIRLYGIITRQFNYTSSSKWEVKAYYNELIKLYELYNFDTIIAVSEYYITQMAVLKFKRKYSNVKWILFSTDPYTDNYEYYKKKILKKYWKKKNFQMEKEIYNKADYCMFTSELYKYVLTTFEIERNKVFPINYPLTRRLSGVNHQVLNSNSKCKLVFAGMVYKEIRNPEFALWVFSQIDNIHLDLFISRGECEDIINQYISDKIRRDYFVSRNEYERMIREEYNILINIGNRNTLQAPSKMIELLSTGKPVINFCSSKDTQFFMVEKYPLGINIINGEKGAVEKVSKFCREMKGKALIFDEVENLFPENTLQNQVELLRSLIES